MRRRVFVVNAAAQRIFNRSRLLINLLEHEMCVLAAHRVFLAEFQFADLHVCRVRAEVDDLEFVFCDGHHVVVVQINDLFRVRDDGIGVARQKIFALADPNDQRRTAARADNFIRFIRADHGQPVGADDFAERGANGLRKPVFFFAAPLVVIIANQMREHFRVGVGFESVPGGEQFILQQVVVFDDAVVDDGDFAGLVQLRMRIFVRRDSMSGPARVADAEVAGNGSGFQNVCESVVDFTTFFSDQQSAII